MKKRFQILAAIGVISLSLVCAPVTFEKGNLVFAEGEKKSETGSETEEKKLSKDKVPETSESETPASETPATEQTESGKPDSGSTTPETSATEAPTTEPPTTEPPATETPVTEPPATETPSTETPGTEVPSTETPATETPVTESPSTGDQTEGETNQTESETEGQTESETDAQTESETDLQTETEEESESETEEQTETEEKKKKKKKKKKDKKKEDEEEEQELNVPQFVMPGFFVNPLLYPAADMNENSRYIYKYLTQEMGLNHAAACGVLANLHLESSFNPLALGDSGSSYGICQWHLGRFSGLMNYCNKQGLDYNTLDGQLAYMRAELEGGYSGILSYIRSVPNNREGAYSAAYYWCMYYEIPDNTKKRSEQRGNLAANEYYPKSFDLDGLDSAPDTDAEILPEEGTESAEVEISELTRYVADSVRVREEPSLEAEVMTTLSPGTVVLAVDEDMDEEKEWTRICYQGEDGYELSYIKSDYLANENLVYSAKEPLNVRKNASAAAETVGRLDTAEAVVVDVVPAGDWVKVHYIQDEEETTGYVMSEYLEQTVTDETAKEQSDILIEKIEELTVEEVDEADESDVSGEEAGTDDAQTSASEGETQPANE